jgi:hypothetical protein
MVGGLGFMAGRAGANGAAREAAQEQRLAGLEGEQGSASVPAPARTSDDTIEQLRQLGELREQGVLTADEFEREKQKLLAG